MIKIKNNKLHCMFQLNKVIQKFLNILSIQGNNYLNLNIEGVKGGGGLNNYIYLNIKNLFIFKNFIDLM